MAIAVAKSPLNLVISDDKFTVASGVGNGASLRAVIQEFSTNKTFWDEMYKKGPLLTGTMGLKKQGPQLIMPDWTLEPITLKELERFERRPSTGRAICYPGTGPVAVNIGVSYDGGYLEIRANLKPDFAARRIELQVDREESTQTDSVPVTDFWSKLTAIAIGINETLKRMLRATE
jgi:hypothetical protein